MPPEKIKKIVKEVDPRQLADDLNKYVQVALREGADAAGVLSMEDVVIDERVPYKCRIPQCSMYGLSLNCPPHAIKVSETKEIASHYEKAVVFKINVSPEVLMENARRTTDARAASYRKIQELANAVESAAFYDGHYMAIGFGAGPCKVAFCRELECTALRGEECRFSLRARPAMEAVGMDVFKTAMNAGWDAYPIGTDANKDSLTESFMMGIVLVE